jgi:hypothetical protein
MADPRHPFRPRIAVMMAASHLTVVRRPSLREGTRFQTDRVVRMLMVVGLCARRVNGAQPASRRRSRCVFYLVARTPPFAAPPDEPGHCILRTH